MIIIEDTRNQIGKHKNIKQGFDEESVVVIRSKLFVGDYARIDNMMTAIDTKKDYVELAMDICGKQHERFRLECIKAQFAGIHLIILVEENKPVQEWVSPKRRNGTTLTQVNGITLGKAMNTMHERYGVEFMYCDKKDTAKKIIEILGG